MQGLERIIAGLGTSGFRVGLLASVNSVTTVDHAAVIRFDGASQARIIASATRDSARINGKYVKDAYERRYFRSDPNRAAWQASFLEQGPQFRRLRPQQLTDENYRYHCYETPGLIDRLSIIAPTGNFLYCINLYRCADTGPFSESEAQAVLGYAPVLAALSVKHDQVTYKNPVVSDRTERVSELAQRLSTIQKRLTQRELEIAARILIGMTSEAIALDLGITSSSVITYRRRAYAKLGIASQSELFSLCYFG
jgi:DNA-binding CsgD family transcriptional regulator